MLTLTAIIDMLFNVLWAALRVAGVIMIAPLLGAMFVPNHLRILLVFALAVAMLPAIGTVPAVSPLSLAGLLTIARELAIGLALGFTLKLAIEAAVLAGQLVSTGTGLSFAQVVDPQAGGIPLLGRFYLIIATLLMLVFNAHLQLIEVLAHSFTLLPIGADSLRAADARELVEFAGLMFSGALKLALPSVVAILMVNLAFGVISRAAPTLNLFAVGFPVTLLMGFLIMLLTIDSHGTIWQAQFTETFVFLDRLLGGS